jgi:hypothetical protein
MVFVDFPYREARYGQRIYTMYRAGREGGCYPICIFGTFIPYIINYGRFNRNLKEISQCVRANE